MNRKGKRYKRAKYIIELAQTGLYSANEIAKHVGFHRTSIERILRKERNAVVFSDLNITKPIKCGQERAKTNAAIASILCKLGVIRRDIGHYIGCCESYIWFLRKIHTTRRPIIPVQLKSPVKDVHKNILEAQKIYIQSAADGLHINIYSADLKQMTLTTIENLAKKIELTYEPHLTPQLPPIPEFE